LRRGRWECAVEGSIGVPRSPTSGGATSAGPPRGHFRSPTPAPCQRASPPARSGVLAPLTIPDETHSVVGLILAVCTDPPTAAFSSERKRRRTDSNLGTGTPSIVASPTSSTVETIQARTASSPSTGGGGLSHPSTVRQHDPHGSPRCWASRSNSKFVSGEVHGARREFGFAKPTHAVFPVPGPPSAGVATGHPTQPAQSILAGSDAIACVRWMVWVESSPTGISSWEPTDKGHGSAAWPL
jgi:hypothetical protein